MSEENKFYQTIIICAYNEFNNIYSCLESLSHTLTKSDDIEVLVIDNSSKDNTIGEIKRAKKLFENLCDFKYITIEHVPLAISRNTGLSIARGSFVTYLDADATVDRNWYPALREYLKENKDRIVFSGKVLNLCEKKNSFSNFYYNLVIRPGQESNGSKLIGANMTFLKSALEEVKGFSNMTDLRGEETFVLRKLTEKFGHNIEFFCSKSIVSNMFSASFLEMLKINSIEAISYSKIFLNSKVSTLEKIYRSAVFLFWVLFFSLCLSQYFKFAFAVFALRPLVKIKFFIRSFKSCLHISLLYGLFSIPANIINMIIFDFYFSYYILISFSADNGHSTTFTVSPILEKSYE